MYCSLRALLDFEQRRLRDVDVAAINQLGHLAIEERQQQRANVRAVNVGVAQQDDATVAQLCQVEIVFADAGAERRYHRANLRVREHLVVARFLDVQDFTLERQDSLSGAVASLFC